MSQIHASRILILDFGSQYTQLIGRRIRELGVYCEIFPWDVEPEHITEFNPQGIILSGGPESTTQENAPKAPDIIWEKNVPILGICYGMQTVAMQLGGVAETSNKREFGYANVSVNADSVLLKGIVDQVIQETDTLDVWMSHGDKVTQIPAGFKVTASSANCPIAAMENAEKHIYCVQFHPEVTHTKQGGALLSRFMFELCGCEPSWLTANIIEESVKTIREKVGTDHVILGLSGGVDSSVVAALLHKAIGQQLTCVFVDTGLLRLHEGDQVMATFAENMGVKVIRIDAEERFLTALKGEHDPERKRKIIGGLFVEIFEEESNKITDAKWLAQGTIYPDVIESAGSKTGKAHVIKSHHNVGGLPAHMRLQLLEPLRELFKDEVRKLGVALGLPPKMVYRHPFPGPGLGVRILGEVKKEYADILRFADHIFMEELHAANLYDKTSQAFVVFIPVKSVGVVGDGRRYDYVVSLRAVETIDFMTARAAHLPYDFVDRVSTRIINEVAGISRVVYDISSKPPATIEWE